MNWTELAKQEEDNIISFRRKVHHEPELGNQEYNTSARIAYYLQSYGIETQRILGTAVIGTLKGDHDGACVMLRSDEDALPVHEETGLEYTSRKDDVMHACGHDMHMAMLLGAAKILAQHRDLIHGTILFVFQPDEEGDGGAKRIIETGVLDAADAAFGIHVDPSLPTGTIGIKYGPFYAAAGTFDITVHGKSVHGALPDQGNDALSSGAEMVLACRQLNGQLDGQPIVVTTGTFQAGTARNVLAGEAVLSGIVRTFGNDRRDKAHKEIKTIIEKVDASYGTHSDFTWHDGYDGVINSDAETHIVEDTARSLFPERVQILNDVTMTTEDFGAYLHQCPGCFYHLGTGSKYPLHSPHFNPDEAAMVYGTAMHCASAVQYLDQAKKIYKD